MSLDRMRDQFEEQLRTQHAEAVMRGRRELKQLAQATVPMEHLTQSKEWDFLLSHLQAAIEELDRVIAVQQESGATDLIFDPAVLATRKALIMRLTVQRDTLEAVLGLPRKILEEGEKAGLELRKYEIE